MVKKFNFKLLLLILILFLIPSAINAGVVENVKYEGYLKAYEGVLNDLLGQKYTSEGYEVLKKEAYLLTDNAYEYPLLYTIVYNKNNNPRTSILTGLNQNYEREERAYYYKNGQVGNVTLIINRDPSKNSIYNRQPINSLNKDDLDFTRNRAISKDTGNIYLYEIDEEILMEPWIEWDGNGYYRTAIHLQDRTNHSYQFLSLVKERNSKGQYRYMTFEKNDIIMRSKTEYERLLKEWKNNLHFIQENPRDLTRKDIDSILQESSFHFPKVVVDGKLLNFDINPVIENNRTLVPLRKILEELNMDLIWDEKTKKIVAKGEGIEISFVVNSKEAYVNGNKIELDVPAKTINGRTLIPLRFISDNLGKEVKWDGNNKVVYIN